MACPGDREKMLANSPTKPILPISSTLPSYTTLNRRRRITCRTCQLPIGYLTLKLCEVESWRTNETREAKMKRDDRLVGAICIKHPINVGVRRRTKGDEEIHIAGQQHPFAASTFKLLEGSHCEAEEAICDGCGTCLGVRITSYELVTSDAINRDGYDDCGFIPTLEESRRWFSFSEDKIEVEPLMSLLNIDMLSMLYHGGERSFFETNSIEESPDIANNSEKWMPGLYRKLVQEDIQSRTMVNNNWPMVHLDLVSISDLPRGTIGREIGVEWAVNNVSQAFSRDPIQKVLVDKSYESDPCLNISK